jgi:hypothetical protein
MKFVNYIFLIIFLLCMAVQYNDPDPFRWMFLYGAAALCCILFALRKLPPYLPLATAVVAGLWILLLLPAVWGLSIPAKEVFSMVHMFSPGVEEVREIGGLSIVMIWMTVLAIKTRSIIRASIR